jgi:glycosyltransferase involved in cell wall biosynthesis
MKVCLVSPEIFSGGYHGGFGFLTRTLGRGLVQRGHEVSVVTVRRGTQGEYEEIDGMNVHAFSTHGSGPRALRALLSRLNSLEYYRKVDADVYHSQAVSYNTYAAQRAVPEQKHIITFQDPFDHQEWVRLSQVDPEVRMTIPFRTRLIFENSLLSRACRRADALYAQAKFLIQKSRRLYRLKGDISFLPNPVDVPSRHMRKSNTPSVCFLGRWDPQKRVERFLELAPLFPDVEFVAMGLGHDPQADARLREKWGGISNLRLTGFVPEEEKSRILEESWALVNTSIREALPVSFLEALAHETPIISGENPDGLTSAFGHHVTDDDYAEGLRWMLGDAGWSERGRRGRRYVKEVHEAGAVVDRHVDIYRGLLEHRG